MYIEEVYKKEPRIEVVSYSGLTIDLCKKMQVLFILRGLRNANDFIYEPTWHSMADCWPCVKQEQKLCKGITALLIKGK